MPGPEMQIGQTFSFEVAEFLDAKQNVTNVDPTTLPEVTFANARATLTDVALAPDGKSLKGNGQCTDAGPEQISIKVDPKRDPGVTGELVLLGEFTVLAGDAAVGNVNIAPGPTP